MIERIEKAVYEGKPLQQEEVLRGGGGNSVGRVV